MDQVDISGCLSCEDSATSNENNATKEFVVCFQYTFTIRFTSFLYLHVAEHFQILSWNCCDFVEPSHFCFNSHFRHSHISLINACRMSSAIYGVHVAAVPVEILMRSVGILSSWFVQLFSVISTKAWTPVSSFVIRESSRSGWFNSRFSFSMIVLNCLRDLLQHVQCAAVK